MNRMEIVKIESMKWKGTNVLFLAFLLGLMKPISAQNQNIPLNHQFSIPMEAAEMQSNTILHSSFKPILQREAMKVVENDTVLFPTLFIPKKRGRFFVARKLFFEHLIFLDSNNIQLSIDPLLELELGDEQNNDWLNPNRYFKNMRGFVARINFGDQLSVATSFRENQAVLPSYLSRRTKENGVAYGQGRTKGFGDYGYDFAMASAYISYSPISRLNIQVGHGKHFVGEGYRSLLLSDLAFNYPFLRLQSDWLNGKLNYQNLFTLFQDLKRLSNTKGEGLFKRKQGVFHYLEYSPTSKFSIGLFEGLIYPSLDSSGKIGVPANYWIPIIGLNTLLNGKDRNGNTKLGINAKYQLFEKLKIYGQLSVFDEQIKNQSYQIGGKLFLGKNWAVQLEYNNGRNATSSNLFHHYNESLDYPIFTTYEEIIGGLYFHWKRWMTKAMFNHIESKRSTVNYIDLRQSYLINPAYNFTLNIGVQSRNENSTTNSKSIQPHQIPFVQNSLYFYFGISTNLQNKYYNY